MGEVLFIVIMLAGLLIPPVIFGQWWLFGAFLTFGIIFGLYEWIAKAKSGKAVSQHFWVLLKKNKRKAYIILGGMLAAWLALIWHLGCG